jgi:hypothetical protein
MLHDSPLKEEFFAWMTDLDLRVAREVAAARCPLCGGPLHQGNYERKPRGGLLAGAGEAFRTRYSLCCGWCRKRALPPSLRFLGRRVYLGAVVVLATVVAQVASTLKGARAVTAVPGRTLRRWGAWWLSTFPATRTWTELRPRFMPPPPDEADLPRSLVERLATDVETNSETPTLGEVCLLAARLLAPATTTSLLDASRFVRGLGGGVILG